MRHHNWLLWSAEIHQMQCCSLIATLLYAAKSTRANSRAQFHSPFLLFSPLGAQLHFYLETFPPGLSQFGSLILPQLLWVVLSSLYTWVLLSHFAFLTSFISSDIALFIHGALPVLVTVGQGQLYFCLLRALTPSLSWSTAFEWDCCCLLVRFPALIWIICCLLPGK